MNSPDEASNALLDVALQLGATRSLEELLPLVLRRIVDLLGAERALFALFDDRGEIEDAVLHNLSWQRGTALPISNRVVSEVLLSREMRQLVNDDLDHALTLHESIRQHGLRFILAVPVIACGRVAGVLYADSTAPVIAETLRRTEILRALAGIVGMAVENVRLLEEQRLRTVLLGKLVHDLRSPLMAVALGAEVARDMITNADAKAILDDVRLAGDRMRVYCESALGFAGIEHGAHEPEPTRLDVGSLVREHARILQRVAKGYGLTLATQIEDTLPTLTTWVDRAGLALDNLVLNAIKYAETGTEVVLGARRRNDAGPRRTPDRRRSAMASLFLRVGRAEANVTRGFVELWVHNRGQPIDPSLLPTVFEEWVRGTEQPHGIPSTGLGLAIVDECVRSLGGCAWVESDIASGTTFHFTVPIEARVTP
jgi:signal transduction histidine kinase